MDKFILKSGVLMNTGSHIPTSREHKLTLSECFGDNLWCVLCSSLQNICFSHKASQPVSPRVSALEASSTLVTAA